tara:strand:- start:174 stop:440 length:267 start_codon:yes stop_codon:yes gene_type:complete
MAKTITENSTNISKYLFADDKPVIMGSDKLTIGSDPVDFYVADLNSSNSTMHTGVTAPEGWTGNKHFFDGTDWTDNPDWVDPADEDGE